MSEVDRIGILFVYGMEWCNPNGDPIFDNEPRIRGGKAFVTDVFLKRRIRDFINWKYGEEEGNKILIKEEQKEDGSLLTVEERVERILGDYKEKKITKNCIETLIKKCWDVRVFGCLVTLKKDVEKKGKGGSIKLIGPVQASFGVSLNSVEKISVPITRVLPTGEEKKGGAIGEKHIVPVAIIEQYIFVNDISAQETKMTKKDYQMLFEALQNFGVIPTSRTTSKNIWPVIIAEIKFERNKYANFTGLIKVNEDVEYPNFIRDYKIDVNPLLTQIEKLKNNKNKVIESYKVYIKDEFKEIIKIPEETQVEVCYF